MFGEVRYHYINLARFTLMSLITVKFSKAE